MGIYLGDKKIQLQLAPQIKGTIVNKIENTYQYTDDDSDSNNKFVTNLVDNYNTLVDKYNNIIRQWGTNKED